ncbi:uncharacterized protein KIAA1614 homolog [Discoglossus pictus]
MSAEVDMRGCPSNQDNEKRQTQRSNKSPRRAKHPPAKSAAEPVIGSSVLQGKVKALREKQKALRVSEVYREDGDPPEDALVTPQLRTYLTEEALKQGEFLDTEQETWRTSEVCETPTKQGAAMNPFNGHMTADLFGYPAQVECNQNANKNETWMFTKALLQGPAQEMPSVPQTVSDMSFESSSLSLAEKVEKNRQELSWKFNKAMCQSEETSHGDMLHQGHVNTSKEGTWLVARDIDGDSGVSLPDSESCRELSVRHEQAKQLLQRARMKARGASPLRASHCVLQNPHSQPTLRRGPWVSGALTDGGSLSDSSSSDYCSCQRGSRGTSPSHVRFQDESEREAEERYRERQQQGPQSPCVNTTPPLKRPSNGHISWTQHLSQSGNGQCGALGSYVNGSDTSQGAALQGTNSRNANLGFRIPQDGPPSTPAGLKPSPHWILPSQPWRIHTELIRETHIGGDSTADSSGEEEGNRSQSKSSRAWVTRKSLNNNPPNVTPETGNEPYPSNTDQQSDTRANPSSLEIDHGKRISPRNSITGYRSKTTPPTLKKELRDRLSDSDIEIQNMTRTYQGNTAIKPGIRTNPHEWVSRTTTNHATSNLQPPRDKTKLNSESGIENLGFKLENGVGTPVKEKTQISSMGEIVSPLDVGSTHSCLTISGRVPVPPAGRAPTCLPSRTNRFTTRPDGISQPMSVPNLQMGDKDQIGQGVQSDPVSKPQKKNRETPCQLSPGISYKEQRARERSQKSSKLDSERPHEVTEHRNQEKIHVSGDQQNSEKSHTDSRQRESGRPHPTKTHQETETPHSARDSPKKDLLINEKHRAAKERKRSERCSVGSQSKNMDSANTGIDTSSSEINFLCQSTSQESLTQDKCLTQAPTQQLGSAPCAAPHSPLQPAAKKGDLRSGMRKIFSTFGLSSRPKLERYQSSSMEQISSAATQDRQVSRDREPCDGAVKPGTIKKSPSLQSLKLMSPFHLPRKASSVQNLLAKSDRSSVYVTGDANTAPRRALSVEDIGSPGMPRAVGRVAEVYPDGTRLLQLQRPPQGTFGFSISSVNGRPDSGVYVQEMMDASTAKLYSGLLRVGDEVLEVNGTKVSFLGPAQLNRIMDHEATLSLRVLHQRRSKC